MHVLNDDDLGYWSVGPLESCETCQQAYDGEVPDYVEGFFTWASCEGCGCTLVRESTNEIEHYQVCENCAEGIGG